MSKHWQRAGYAECACQKTGSMTHAGSNESKRGYLLILVTGSVRFDIPLGLGQLFLVVGFDGFSDLGPFAELQQVFGLWVIDENHDGHDQSGSPGGCCDPDANGGCFIVQLPYRICVVRVAFFFASKHTDR